MWKLFLPLILGYAASALCPMAPELRRLPQQPPNWVFAVVWPVLYLLVGHGFARATSPTAVRLYWLLITLLTGWVVVYSCHGNRTLAVFVLAAIVATLVGLIGMHTRNAPTLTLLPVLAWCLVAFQLNWAYAGRPPTRLK